MNALVMRAKRTAKWWALYGSLKLLYVVLWVVEKLQRVFNPR